MYTLARLLITLDITPVDNFIKTMAAMSAKRLKESAKLNHDHTGYDAV